ncbi:Acyl-CoA dehydrogenase family member 11 [Anabarilius grahami]|uniref:Acyl-CoA dehydrogenase family member 11 n=1 Tax=Anabarilius grahami TaxID=495550 RepID=A0A3N0XWW7_ANAGA|nr:Acyl-CoA dehydrogenase family member 11 [Anabarilius grahami]
MRCDVSPPVSPFFTSPNQQVCVGRNEIHEAFKISHQASGTETVARRQQGEWFKLYGFKWFTSATDADMTLTLARVTDEHGHTTPGSRGLSLFLADVWDSDGSSNGIEVQRLKDKLGTRQMPTAELLLDGMNARLVKLTHSHASIHPLNIRVTVVSVRLQLSEEGRGVASIANMLTITRIYNTAVSVVSEGLESFGGQGYIEDTGLPSMLRDAQVNHLNECVTSSVWCDQDLCPVVSRDAAGCFDPQTTAMDSALVYDGLKP